MVEVLPERFRPLKKCKKIKKKIKRILRKGIKKKGGGRIGYIGSHICVELLESGYDVVVIDDFSIQNQMYWIQSIRLQENMLSFMNLMC